MAKGKSSKSVHWRGSNVKYAWNDNRVSCRKCIHYEEKICNLHYTDLSIAGYNLFKFCKSFLIEEDEKIGKYYGHISEISNKKKEKINKTYSMDLKNKKKHKDAGITVNCKVLLYDYQFGEVIEYIIVDPKSIDILNNKISYNSPIGSALIGKTKDCKVDVVTPEGTAKYRIVRWSKI